MAKPKRPITSEPLETIACTVRQSDFHYIFRELGDDRYGIRQEIMSELFHKFAAYVRTLEIQPYPQNKHAPQRIRNLARVVNIGIGVGDSPVPRRTGD